MNEYTFTITATFTDDNQQDAWDAWVEWLTEPAHIEGGTTVIVDRQWPAPDPLSCAWVCDDWQEFWS